MSKYDKTIDKGKVWIPGTPEPVIGIRVGENFFVLGKDEEKKISYWVENDFLYVDLHSPNNKIRKAKKIPLKLIPTKAASLFSGFVKTKHTDIKVVPCDNPGIKVWEIMGKDYEAEGIEYLDGQNFWKKVKFEE